MTTESATPTIPLLGRCGRPGLPWPGCRQFLFEMLDNSILNVALPTIGGELHASTIALQWVTGAYAVVFGGLMLAFGAVADRFGRRRVMLVGLVLLGLASLATAFVTTSGELIVVRSVMGIAAAMTTPGSIALAFRLFDQDGLRVRAMTLITTVGLVGLAVGPTAGGFVLSFAPWQVLLLVNVPIAVLAFIGIRTGITADDPAGVGIALTGTVLAALFTGDIARSNWSAHQTAEFHDAVVLAGLTLTVLAAALVCWGFLRTRNAAADKTSAAIEEGAPEQA